MHSQAILEWVSNLEKKPKQTYGTIETALEEGYVNVTMGSRAMRLTDIYLPTSELHQGYGTRILDALEAKSDQLGLELVVGPLVDFDDDEPNYLERMVLARGYQPYPPFSAIRVRR